MLRPLAFIGKKIGQQKIKNINTFSVPSTRLLSTLLDSKERAAENIYFREQESMKLAEIRAKFEKIITSEDHADKQEIFELLGIRIKNFNVADCLCFNYFALLTIY